MIKKSLVLIAFIVVNFITNSTIYGQPVLDFVGQLTYPEQMSDVWGYVDDNGNEYALVGTEYKFSIVDVTVPANPVELHEIPGPSTIWRDIKTWQNYAYIVNESSEGMVIVDMAGLPGNITHSNWTGADFQGTFINLSTAHNLYIDDFGYAYLVGTDSVDGVTILDLNTDPTNPTIVGIYNNALVHDCFVRDNILWTAEAFQGRIGIIDITDKSNPTIINYFASPSGVAHNCWLSDDDNYLFTTDETGGGTVGCFDVSDFDNPFFVSSYSSTTSDAIPHNTFVVDGNYIMTSYYTDGVTLADVSDPYNIVEIDEYDTSPDYSDVAFKGCWGVYPYLPSGNILATDMQEGLYILGNAGTVGLQPVNIDIKVLLEGATNSSGTMETDLANESLLPLNQPYSAAPYNYAGAESLANIPTNMVDWVLVEARTGTPSLGGARSTVTLETRAAILLSDGSIVDTNGNNYITFNNLSEGESYHFCVRHRNHLDVLTANPLTVNVGVSSLAYDFRTSISSAFGTSQQKLVNNYAAMIAGDYNQDGIIQVTDRDSWKSNPSGLYIYDSNDGNLDGVLQITDQDTWYPNRTSVGISEIGF